MYVPTVGAATAAASDSVVAAACPTVVRAAAASAASDNVATASALPRSTRTRDASAATASAATTTKMRVLRSGPAPAEAAATPTTRTAPSATEPSWQSGTYFAVCMRDLTGVVNRALDGQELDVALAAACSLLVLARNAYNPHFINSELGQGCHCYLNAHGTLKADGTNHPWLEKITRIASPFATSDTRVVLSLSDALAVSQSWETFEGGQADEGSGVAKLYAARADDVAPSQAVMWMLDRLGVPDIHIQRSLRPDVPTIYFGWGRNGWEPEPEPEPEP